MNTVAMGRSAAPGASGGDPVRRRSRGAWLAVAVAVLAPLPGAAAAGRSPRTPTAPGSPGAAVRLGALGRRVPSSFLGLSIEYSDLPRFETRPAFARLLRRLAAPGAGPLSLRLGGQSADSAALTAAGARANGYVLGPGWFSDLAELARSARLRVILDLNLASRAPRVGLQEARAALAILPPHSLQAFEIGNEPDLYRAGMIGFQRAARDNPGPLSWAFTYGPTQYAANFRAYASPLRRLAPAVPVAGPATAFPYHSWWAALPRTGRSRVGMVTVHRYPFSACRQGLVPYPTIGGFLQRRAALGLAATVAAEAAAVHRLGLPFRVTELGSASCGGLPGTTDTFATALWAPEALFGLLSVGVDGVNVHTRFDAANTPLDGAATLRARPLLYGMVLFARMLGPGARLQAAAVRGRGLSAWAVHLRDGIVHVLLINHRPGARRVAVEFPPGRRATAITLRAPSLSATDGVTIGGRSLDANARWQGRERALALRPRHGTYRVLVPGTAALLLTLRAR